MKPDLKLIAEDIVLGVLGRDKLGWTSKLIVEFVEKKVRNAIEMNNEFIIGDFKISKNQHGVWFSAISGERNGEAMTVTPSMMEQIFKEMM